MTMVTQTIKCLIQSPSLVMTVIPPWGWGWTERMEGEGVEGGRGELTIVPNGIALEAW